MSTIDIKRSTEVPFEQRAVEREVPEKPGVYEILQNELHPHYNGRTRILKIGKSEGSLRQPDTRETPFTFRP